MLSPKPEFQEIIDPQRLAALNLTGLLDTLPEEAFDQFTKFAQQILGVPVALISLVDKDRQFFKSQVGLPEPWAQAQETPLSHSFCQHVVATKVPLVVNDARKDPVLKDNCAVSEIGVVAYAGVPLRTSSGHVIGAFCAINNEPLEWTESDVKTLTFLADLVMREVALRQIAQHLYAKYQTLQNTEEQRDSLVHMVVHDLRTPLTSLVAGLHALSEITQLDELPKELLNIAVRSANSLSGMIDTILDVSRGEAGLLVLDRKEILPSSIIAFAMEQVGQLSRGKSLGLSFEIAPNLPPFFADKDKLGRVLINLLGNAIRYTPTSGQIKISVSAQRDDETYLWCVSDTGSGIAAGELESIFEKFGQALAPGKGQSTTGLGLTFCRLVVEAHGGEIWAESPLDQGSRFYFTIAPLEKNTI